jgi:hypothetical protein
VRSIVRALSLLAIGCGNAAVEKTPDAVEVTGIVRALYDIDGFRDADEGDLVAFFLREFPPMLEFSIPPPLPEEPSSRVASPAGAFSGCTCMAGRCEFAPCREDDSDFPWQMTGTLVESDTRTAFDLSYMDRFESWHLTGRVALSPDRADGTLSLEKRYLPDRGSVSAAIELRDVAVDSTRCPIGGAFHGEVDVDLVVGNGARFDYHFAGELVLGPTCFPPGE